MLAGALTLKQGNFQLDSGRFALDTAGITVLFGRSGSGKSTLLRAMTGVDRHTRGTLSFNGERWQEGAWRLPTPRRDIGFVFQDAALFPHLSVRGNLAFAVKRAPRGNGPTLEAMAERVGIARKLDQDVLSLSGGEKQRVAIARALLSRPRLMFMDEPLSALDWRAKADLVPLIKGLAVETGVPILYITHAPIEVARLADRVVFMADGRIERVETLREAMARPDSPLFDDEGAASVLEGEIGERVEGGLRAFGPPEARLWVGAMPSVATGASTRVRVLARDVSLALDDPARISIQNHLAVRIERIDTVRDGHALVACRLADAQLLLAELTVGSVARLGLQPGQSVFALIKSVALVD